MPKGLPPAPIAHEPGGLTRTLGLFTTTTIVIGAMVGSGIFRTPGDMASKLGSPELLLGVWALAGFITLLGALSNAEVSSMIPVTGGQYVYFEKMYGPFPAFLYGWSVFSVIQTGSIAAIAYVFGEYTTQFFGLNPTPGNPDVLSFSIPFIGDIRPTYELTTKLIAAGLVALLTTVNYIGVRFGGVVQNIFTVGKLAAMLVLVILALVMPDVGSFANLANDSATITGGFTLVAIAAALQGAFWTYDGWNNVTYIAGEVREPQRTIPRALITGLAITIAVYLVINFAYSYVLPIDEMAQSRLVAYDVANRLFPDGGRWIALLVMISTFGTTNGTILASARVYYSMARREVFPQMLGKSHPRFHTPAPALVAQAVWTIVLIFSGTFNTLIDMLLFVSWVFYAAGGVGLFVLRKKYPNDERPYRVPLYPIVPALFVLFALAYVILTIQDNLTVYNAAVAEGKPAILNFAFGTALVLIGTPIYLYYHRKRKAAELHED